MDYYEALKKLYTPQFGSIWKAPNKIWTSGFAGGSAGDNIHPSVIEKIFSDEIIVSMVPGTSKHFVKGSCVYIVDLTGSSVLTHFLINMAMPYHIDDVKELERGWNGKDELSDKQKNDFIRQIEFCRGYL